MNLVPQRSAPAPPSAAGSGSTFARHQGATASSSASVATTSASPFANGSSSATQSAGAYRPKPTINTSVNGAQGPRSGLPTQTGLPFKYVGLSANPPLASPMNGPNSASPWSSNNGVASGSSAAFPPRPVRSNTSGPDAFHTVSTVSASQHVAPVMAQRSHSSIGPQQHQFGSPNLNTSSPTLEQGSLGEAAPPLTTQSQFVHGSRDRERSRDGSATPGAGIHSRASLVALSTR